MSPNHVRSSDRDLLEGVDAEAMSIRGQEGVAAEIKQNTLSPVTPGGSGNSGRSRTASTATQKVVEFER